ncbi:MAG: tail fiber domain-containing protein [Bacteroidales bacterium]|jgi:hypothetical protein|nr:tail fiber domain-containing protein [Bacteroidales bacterium]
MKKLALIFLAITCLGTILFAQAPEAFKYQAVLRNTDGELIAGQEVLLKISILDLIPGGEMLYSEEHSAVTDPYGAVSLTIGEGTGLSGEFTAIAWHDGEKYLKIEIFDDGSSSFAELGTFQLVSVPYALFAGSASKLGDHIEYSSSPDTLFVVRDYNGEAVFIVYPDGAEVITNEGSKGKIGGFAVSGRTTTKADGKEILRVTPDSTRIYINEPLKKGSLGGFAVSGRTSSKGSLYDYLQVTKDSTRIITQNSTGGFGIKDLSTGTYENYLNLTPQNYFIGHHSGDNISSGQLNLFLGWESGSYTNTGSRNVFIGPLTGHKNSNGFGNIFIGNEAGYHNANIDSAACINTEGDYNVYIGYSSGKNLTKGRYNTYVGFASGASGLSGEFNTFVGNQAGNQNAGTNNVYLGVKAGEVNRGGSNNVMIGNYAGYLSYDGSDNVFIGYQAGYSQSGSDRLYIANNSGTPLIYGEFNTPMVRIYGDLDVTGNYTKVSDIHLKTNLTPFESGLEKIQLLTAYYFQWNDEAIQDFKLNDKQQIGLNAQDVEKVFPEFVSKDSRGYKSIDYLKLTPVLVEAIKEQQQKINQLEKENEEIKKRLLQLEQIVHP